MPTPTEKLLKMRNNFSARTLKSILQRVALAALICLPGMGAGKVYAEEDTVTFVAQGLPLPRSTSVGAIAQRAVLRAFLDRNPDIQIEAFTMPQIGVDAAMDSGPLMAISAGMGPNAIYVNFRQSATYNEQGFLVPLEILLARLLSENPAVRETDARGNWLEDPSAREVENALSKIRERVNDITWPVVYREDLTGRSEENHVWSLPTANVVGALFYRKDLFQEAGLDPDRPPNTWDEFLEYARILHDPALNRHAFAVPPGVNLSYQVYPFLVSTGGRAMERDKEGNWQAAFADSRVAEGILFIWRLFREPFLKPDGREIRGSASIRSDVNTLWSQGRLAMRLATLSDEMLAVVSPQLVGVAPVPMSPFGVRGGVLNAQMIGVFSQSTPEQQLAVMRYIWFITSEDAQRIRTRIFVDNGYGEFVNPDLLRNFGYERVLSRVPEDWISAFEDAMLDGVPEPYGKGTQFIYRMMSRPINYALEQNFAEMSHEEAIASILVQLEDAATMVNQQALGILSPEELRQRRLVGGGVLLVLVVCFFFGLGSIWRTFSKASPSIDWKKHRRNLIWGWALLLPGFGLIIVWQYVPLLFGGLSIAFMDYRVVLDSTFVGIDNFAEILYSHAFWMALWREFHFVALTIGLGFWPPILLAILLQEVPTNFAKYFYRTVFYLPSVLIGIVVMFLWMQLFDPSASGTLNQMLLSLNSLGPLSATLIKFLLLGCWLSLIFTLIWLPIRLEEMPGLLKLCLWAVAIGFIAITVAPLIGAVRDGGVTEGMATMGSLAGRFNIEPMRWLQDPAMAMACIVIPSVWASSGPGCIIYLAGLKSVPDELYEAAAIDGAGFWHKVFYIVLPRLKFLIVLNLIMAMVAAFKGGADQILVMTGGGPNEATTTLSLMIFYRTFMDLDYGIGTAMAWIMGGILIGFTAYQMKLLSRAEFRAAGSSK